MVFGIGRYTRLGLVWVTLLSFSILSLIPRGVMPVVAADGSVILVICADDMMADLVTDHGAMGHDHHQMDHSSGKSAEKHAYCSWAMAHSVFDLASPIKFWQPAGVFVVVATLVSVIVLRVAAVTGLPPATGPPPTF